MIVKTVELAWGLIPWPLAPVIVLLVTMEDWDMSLSSVVVFLVGMALAYGLAGVLLWLPAGVWLSRRVPEVAVVRGVAFAALGFALGAAGATLFVFALGNPTWPGSVGTVVELAAIAAGASIVGWILAVAIRAHRRRQLAVTRAV